MKLKDLQDRATEKFKRVGDSDERAEISAIVKFAVEGVGFHFDPDGEICDPRPAPSTQPRQQNVRWSGGRRRR